MGSRGLLCACGLLVALTVGMYAGSQLISPVLARSAISPIAPSISARCDFISATVTGCRLTGQGFTPLESTRMTYTLQIPVQPEIVPVHPTPRLWGLEPPRVQCLTYRRDACVRYRTSDRGVFGPLLVHLTMLKLPGSGGATTQHFQITVHGATGDQATTVLPQIRVVP